MSKQLMLDVDQASELKAAFRRSDWTNAEIKRLCEGNTLAQVRNVVLGRAVINAVKYVIDCDADPFLPDGWKAEEHKKGGQLEWDPSKVSLYLSKNQQNGKFIEGNELRKELAKMPVMNVNVLDWYLAHPELIPDEWKDKAVFFWGTIYRGSSGRLYVRCLCWGRGRWDWGYGWLGSDFDGSSLAALLQVDA